MRIPDISRAATLLVAAVLVTAPAVAQQSQESVAEAARKARTQKKSPEKPTKVITNDDLPGTKTGPEAAPATSTETPPVTSKPEVKTAPATGAGGSGGNPEPPKDEAYWRTQFRTARAKLASTEKELDILERELQKVQVQYYNDPTDAMRQQYSRKDVDEKRATIEAKKKEVAELRQNLEDLEAELRQSGGDPSWAR